MSYPRIDELLALDLFRVSAARTRAFKAPVHGDRLVGWVLSAQSDMHVGRRTGTAVFRRGRVRYV
jgi:hypothetical protein